MKKYLLPIIIIFLSGSLFAQVPQTLNFQGVLTDASDVPQQGTFTFIFAIYDDPTAGTKLWEETHSLTTDINGLYNAVLGSSSGTAVPIDEAFDKQYYLQITVDGTPMTSRVELTSPAYTLNDNLEDLADGALDGANITDGTITTSKISGTISIADGGTGATTAAAVRTALGLAIGTNVQAYDADLADLADGTLSDSKLEANLDRTNLGASNNIAAGNYITALGGIHVGGTSDPQTDDLIVDGGISVGTTTNYPSDIIVSGGIHVGGTSDPGTDNLVVDGTTKLTGSVAIGISNPTSAYPLYINTTDIGTYNIFSRSTKATANSVGGTFSGRTSSTSTSYARGVWAESINDGGTGPSYGVYADARGTSTGTHYGVFGTTNGSGIKYGLYCSGNGAYTGTWVDVSDKKFKTEIAPIDDVLSKVLQLKPSSYIYKTDEYSYMGFSEGRDIGLIAQDVELLFPEVVSQNHHPGPQDEGGKYSTEGIDYKGIDYNLFAPILIKAIQEQQEIIDGLKNENAVLKSDVGAFEARLEKLETILNAKASNK